MTHNVAFGVNLGFLPQVKLVIASILASTKQPADFRFFVLHAREESAVPGIVQSWENEAVRAVPVDNPFASMAARLSPASALRLQIPQALPDVGRAIYLDADTLVRRDLTELASTDLQGQAVGGVLDTGMYVVMARQMARGDATIHDYMQSHGFDREGKRYINAGIMLMDLDKLRALDFGTAALNMLAADPERFHWYDQCVTNKVLLGQIALLDPRWNALANAIQMKRRHRFASPEVRSMLKLQSDDPWIIHYAGGKKPWATNKVWHAGAWWQYADDSWPRPPKGPFGTIWDRWFGASAA